MICPGCGHVAVAGRLHTGCPVIVQPARNGDRGFEPSVRCGCQDIVHAINPETGKALLVGAEVGP